MIDFETFPADQDPLKLIESINHVRRQHDSLYLLKIMAEISGKDARVWGEDNIGFDEYQYVYKTGKTGVWPIISFTPSLYSLIHAICLQKPIEVDSCSLPSWSIFFSRRNSSFLSVGSCFRRRR